MLALGYFRFGDLDMKLHSEYDPATRIEAKSVTGHATAATSVAGRNRNLLGCAEAIGCQVPAPQMNLQLLAFPAALQVC